MRFSADCVPCLLNRVVYEVDLVAPERRDEAIKHALQLIADGYPHGVNSAKLATKVHEAVYRSIGSEDPYLDLKERSNRAAKSMLAEADAFVKKAKDPLQAACQVAITGNVMDFGIKVGMDTPEAFGRSFKDLLNEGLQINDVPRLYAILEKAENVVYLTDNAGEIVLDRFLVQQIQAIGPEVIGVVKGRPILTDATEKDLKETGMDQVFNAWTTTDQFAVGVDLERMEEDLSKRIVGADLVVAKGMANFEALSDEPLVRPIAYLLRAKCRPVAEAIGAKKDWNVVKVVE